MVDSSHYRKRGGVEAIDYVISNSFDYLEGSVIKYLHRYPFKGTPVQDLKKARDFLNWLIEREEKKLANTDK